ncbi:hypothetical protein HMPREF2764_05580 [Streptococcus sp. HMSC073F11]|uniref:DUF6287 domain-containing protein n=1 Tax=Streptococcus sp. HMSC073F11 TaxID=1739268 RepID=UPI0008A3EFCE|nr:DUF6287 domain-containing protein [Streptococcus sp. HMSC073F11]OFL54353.1 hypothetical protein HMPREF2764_05580 [Streptococcus sp. HMSC073F11]
MKKLLFLFSASILTISLLTACQPQSENTPSASSEVTTSSSSSSTSTSEEKKTDYTLYNTVLKEYAKVLDGSPASHTEVNSKANLKNTYPNEYSGLQYSLYDLDQDGTDELLIGLKTYSNYYDLLDIRTLKNDEVIRLTNAENNLDFIGERVHFNPLENGYFQLSTRVSANQIQVKLYKLNQDRTRLELVRESDTDEGLGTKPPYLDIRSFSWKSVTSLINGEISLPSESKGMDISAIQNGDFSSVAGTWRNGTGIEFTFDKNGLVSDHSKVSIEHAKETDRYLKASLLSKAGGAGGAAIAFLPAGIPITMSVTSSSDNGYTDPSDTTQDRLWFGHQLINGSTEGFFYKVE